MLNNIVYIVNDFTSLSGIFHVNNKGILSVILNNKESYPDLLSQIYKPGISKQQSPFCICFDLSNPALANIVTNEFIENKQPFLQIVFSKNYYLSLGRPAIVFLASSETLNATNEFILLIEKCLAGQGYDSIRKILLSADFEDEQTFPGGIMLDGNNELKNGMACKYFNLLSKTNFYNNYIGYKNLLPHEIEPVENGLRASESNFEKRFPLRYEVMKTQIDLFTKSEKLLYDLENARQQIHNKETYLEIMLTLDQANQINKFYYYEYEILPLWYKQLGQIMKVLMGKRTFRSLFSDNVKKYKD